jgi:hypothetical protein
MAVSHVPQAEAFLREALGIFQQIGAAETPDVLTELEALTCQAPQESYKPAGSMRASITKPDPDYRNGRLLQARLQAKVAGQPVSNRLLDEVAVVIRWTPTAMEYDPSVWICPARHGCHQDALQ